MTDRDIEMRLKKAVENTAPDGLARLLSDVENRKGDRKMTNAKRKPRWTGLVAACLALVLIAGFGGFYYSANYAVATTVSLDVNPSIELKVNRSEKVLSCTGLNAEGQDILSSMNGGADLEGAKLGVAVNAIVGAIVRAGYLDSLSSAILISVEDKDAARGERLQAQLVAEVDGVLQNAANAAGVLSQYMTFDAGLNQQAQQNNISAGKAAYINQVIALNSSLKFDELAELSVEELRDLIGAPAMPIGRAQAAYAASEYAGVLALDSVIPDVDPELDDPVPHYEVELTWGSRINHYEYTVDAFTGQVLSGRKDAVNASADEPAPGVTADEAFNSAAERFHANHPELSGYNIFDIYTEYDRDGHYDVSFWCGGYEFEYEVDARTGEVLREETHYRQNASGGTAPTAAGSAGTAPVEITVDDAKAAALNHAGLTASQVIWEKTEKDVENGKTVYEVDFRTADTEYDYKIGAADGAVISVEKEAVQVPAAQGEPGNSTAAVQDIGLEAAKAIALERAGVSSDAVWRKTQREYDDGRLEYELEFYTSAADVMYEVTVLAADGSILKYETEIIPAAPGTSGQTQLPAQPGPQSADIGAEAAKSAALARAGVSASDAAWLKCEHDYDDGRHCYDLEFECGATVYECEVSAADGSVLGFSSEPCDNLAHHHDTAAHTEDHHSGGSTQTTDIGAEAAVSAALAHAGLSQNQVTGLKCERDYDDGRLEYEVEFKSNGYEYEYKLDASTGSVLEHERDFDD